MKFLLGKKLGMSQIFDAEGNVIPVTIIHIAPNVVTQIKTKTHDGYEAIQLGTGSVRVDLVRKPQRGHFKKLGSFKHVREFRIRGRENIAESVKRGDGFDVSIFQEGDVVAVSGTSKAKGFQGVVKRHGFHGAPATHGTKHAHREPGSIGSTWPQRVPKGRRMAGRMGGGRETVRNRKIVKVDPARQSLLVKGAVPGRRGTLVEIRG